MLMNATRYSASVLFAAASTIGCRALAADTIQVRSGSEVRLGRSWNCDDSNLLSQVSIIEQPTQGTAEVRTVPGGAPCNGMPIVAVFYRSGPGYRGQAEVFYRIAQPGSTGRVNCRSTRKDIVVR